ncbi:hypothetical protein DB29_01379 [Shouchella clausii]|nr:hypothetical protein DB29_01379 [Shouchella clausii]
MLIITKKLQRLKSVVCCILSVLPHLKELSYPRKAFCYLYRW